VYFLPLSPLLIIALKFLELSGWFSSEIYPAAPRGVLPPSHHINLMYLQV
jgi:hypothetical protein